MRKPIALSLTLISTGILATGAWAQVAATRSDFDALAGYFAAGSATWRQDNSDAGDGEPTHWLRRHAVDGDVSTAEVVAVRADGSCEPVSTIRYRFDSHARSITSEAVAPGGPSLRGTVEPLGGMRFRIRIEGTLADGTQLRMRDTTDRSEPGVATTSAERWADGAWMPLDSATWRRVPSAQWCRPGA